MSSIKSSNYDVVGADFCETSAPSHCHQEDPLSLPCTDLCFIEHSTPKVLSEYGNHVAGGMTIDYECIPIRLLHAEDLIDIHIYINNDRYDCSRSRCDKENPPHLSLITISNYSKSLATLSSRL